jgi:hypothetical protein
MSESESYNYIQQTSTNAQGLIQLAARIDRLTPILTEVAQRDPIVGQTIVDNLQQLATLGIELNKLLT